MNFVKINRGIVELRNSNGILQRVLSERAQSADLSNCQKWVVITKFDGTVELRNVNGILERTITSRAQDAKFNGDDILITKFSGLELRSRNGILIRNF